MDLKDFMFDGDLKADDSGVIYYLYTDNTEHVEDPITIPEKLPIDGMAEVEGFSRKSHICFAALRAQMNDEPKYNRIAYKLADDQIVDDDRYLWMHTAKRFGFLPKYIDLDDMLERNYMVLDLKEHNLNQLYVYLSMGRSMQAHPVFVHNALVLFRKYKADFIAAMLGSSYIGPRATSHNFMPYTRGYLGGIERSDGSKGTPATLVDVSYMVGTYNASQNEFIGKAHSKLHTGFSVAPNITAYRNELIGIPNYAKELNKTYSIPLKKIGHPLVSAAIHAATQLETKKALMKIRLDEE